MKANKFTRETISALGTFERNFPKFEIGDAIAVSQRIKEGDKERLQVFEGDVIAIGNNGASSTFLVRKIGANSVPVERIFPYYCSIIESIKIVRKGQARRAKLYYMRDRIGKSARVREKIVSKTEQAQSVADKSVADKNAQ